MFTYNELLIISALVETYIYLLYEVYGQSPPTAYICLNSSASAFVLIQIHSSDSENPVYL